MDTETTTAAPTTTKSAPPTAVDDAAKTTASPAAQEEYTNRLLSSYELIKAQNAGSISIRHLLDALQTNRELLRTLEECADWSTQSRHECYRELFIALQQEEKDRTAWNKSKIEGKAAMRQAGMKVASEKGGEENHDDDDDDDDDAFRPTGATKQILLGQVAGLVLIQLQQIHRQKLKGLHPKIRLQSKEINLQGVLH